MGEIRGLTRPYNSTSADNNSSKNYMNLYHPRTKIATKDLYSQYDDDTSSSSPVQHYFFLPKKEKDMCKFREAFIEMNKSAVGRSYTTPLLSTHTIQHHNKCKLNPLPPPLPPKHTDSGGDYCLIKNDSNPVFKQTSCPSSLRVKRENLREFELRLPNYSSISSSNVKIDLEHNDVTSHLTPKKISTKTTTAPNNKRNDTNVDYRSCSSCIKSKTLKGEADNTESRINEQNLTRCGSSSTRSVFCRYLCMGVLTLFVPCILCYTPGRCRTPCSATTTTNERHSPSRGTINVHRSIDSNKEKLVT